MAELPKISACVVPKRRLKPLKVNKKHRGLKIMTYILGASCKDGVVLVADRKATAGKESSYVDKIKQLEQLPGIVFGAAGISTLFEEFIEELPKLVIRNMNLNDNTNQKLPENVRYAYTYYNFRRDCVSLMKSMYDFYTSQTEVIPEDQTALQVIFVNMDGKDYKPRLWYMDWDMRYPVPLENRFIVIGQPELGEIFLKCWNPEYSIEETAKLASFIIKYIETEGLSDGVGVGEYLPQVWFFYDNKNFRELDEKDVKKLLEGIDNKIKETQTLIGSKSKSFKV